MPKRKETGFRVTRVEPVFTVFMSPGSVTETLLFIAEYQADDRRGDGGGLAAEGGTLKYWVAADAGAAGHSRWRIMDAKTIILLHDAECRHAPRRLSGKERVRSSRAMALYISAAAAER